MLGNSLQRLIVVSLVLIFSFTVNAQAPQVIGILPTQNEISVDVATSISITFDMDIDPATTNGSTIKASGRTTGPHAGVVTYNASTLTATLTLNDAFAPGELVTVIATSGIESIGSSALASAFTWQFTAAVSGQSSAIFLPQATYPVGDKPFAIFAADLDGDNDLDLATANFNSDNISILMNNGDGTMASQVLYAGGANPWDITAADFDGDGDLDLATSNWGGASVSVLLNLGGGLFSPLSSYSVSSNPHPLCAADLDGDGDLDLAIGHYPGNVIALLMNNGDGTFADKIFLSSSAGVAGICAADVDGDADLDLITANQDGNDVNVLHNNGDGTFASYISYASGSGARYVSAADFDGDGDLDLATANRFDHTISVLSNNGTSEFNNHTDYSVSGDTYTAIASDLDGDADLDIASANVNGSSVSVLLNDGNGLFTDQVSYPVGLIPTWVVAADLNGNGHIDLATCNAYSDNISILLNDGIPQSEAMVFGNLDTIYTIQAFAITPGQTSLYLGNFTEGHVATDIDPASIRINGYMPDEINMVDSHPNFIGEVWELEVGLTSFIQSFDPWYDSKLQQYVVTASYTEGGSIHGVGQFIAVGHISGDINGDQALNISDLTYLVSYFFRNGPQPVILELADCDGSGGIPNISDLTRLVDYLFRGGEQPTHP